MSFFIAMLALVAGRLDAAGIVGIWATEPDGKGQIGHVRIAPCGAAFCGTVIRAFDQVGQEITTPNVGRQIMQGIVQRSAGNYGGGTVFVPVMKAEYPVELTVSGDKLTLRACNRVGVCRRQSWTRVD